MSPKFDYFANKPLYICVCIYIYIYGGKEENVLVFYEVWKIFGEL